LFLVSHADGTIIVYDRERDDGAFTAHEPGSLALIPPTSDGSGSSSASSQKDWNPLDSIYVTLPPWHPVTVASGLSGTGGKMDKDKAAKNPVSHWRVSKRSIVGEAEFECIMLQKLMFK
jgi:catabolite repression protein CreC